MRVHERGVGETRSCGTGTVAAAAAALRRYLPVSRNHLPEQAEERLRWDAGMEYQPVLELGSDASESFARYSEMQRILAALPGLDCGGCGAPSCKALAEDVVRGEAAVEDCVVLIRERMEAVLRALRIDPGDPHRTR